jgi:methionyl-tRNA synthetase
MKMAEDHIEKLTDEDLGTNNDFSDVVGDEYLNGFEKFNLQKVSDIVWERVADIDRKIQETEPFKLVKEDKEAAAKIIRELVIMLYQVSVMLKPLLPDTSEKIQKAVNENKKPEEPIFARID